MKKKKKFAGWSLEIMGEPNRNGIPKPRTEKEQAHTSWGQEIKDPATRNASPQRWIKGAESGALRL